MLLFKGEKRREREDEKMREREKEDTGCIMIMYQREKTVNQG